MNWAALETPLDPAPTFPIEPCDKDPRKEIERVVEFRREMRLELPAARIAAVPNAGKRGQKAINQARAEGAAWGFPDLMVFHEGRIAFLEFKNGKGEPSAHQIEWMNFLDASGFDVACVRTAIGAFHFLRSRGWPL